MTTQSQQPAPAPGAVPASIQLEDFIEAVTRGVSRALAAQDEVSGYAARIGGGTAVRPITILAGIFPYPPPSWPPYEVAGGENGTTLER